MSPIPGEPHGAKPQELTTSDGRRVKLKIPGLAPPQPTTTEERAATEPPRDDPRRPINPAHAGSYEPGTGAER